MAGYWTVADERLTARQAEGDVSIIGGARGSPTCDRRGGGRPTLGIMCNLMFAREIKARGRTAEASATKDEVVGGGVGGMNGRSSRTAPPPRCPLSPKDPDHFLLPRAHSKASRRT